MLRFSSFSSPNIQPESIKGEVNKTSKEKKNKRYMQNNLLLFVHRSLFPFFTSKYASINSFLEITFERGV